MNRFQRLFAHPRLARWLFNLYPPYLFTATQVTAISPDWRTVSVRLPLFLTRNFVGTQFGGALYALADPWFMIILLQQLGEGYIVWDRAATIRFVQPGRGTVYATFSISEAQVEEIRRTVDDQRKMDAHFSAQIVDGSGVCIAEVEKVLYVRRKGARPTMLSQEGSYHGLTER